MYGRSRCTYLTSLQIVKLSCSQAIILPVALYKCETWSAMIQKVNVFIIAPYTSESHLIGTPTDAHT